MHGCVYSCLQITNSRDRIDYHLKSTYAMYSIIAQGPSNPGY